MNEETRFPKTSRGGRREKATTWAYPLDGLLASLVVALWLGTGCDLASRVFFSRESKSGLYCKMGLERSICSRVPNARKTPPARESSPSATKSSTSLSELPRPGADTEYKYLLP
jgi:hypothetical protein